MDIGTLLILSTIFGSIGVGYYIYGRQQRKFIPAIAGILLCVYPFFMSNVLPTVIVGIVLVIVPWVIKE